MRWLRGWVSDGTLHTEGVHLALSHGGLAHLGSHHASLLSGAWSAHFGDVHVGLFELVSLHLL